MPCYSPLKGWKDSETGGIVFRGSQGHEHMEVACGQCLGCRLDRSRIWAMRICHEASLYESNCFVTLTYRDEWEASQAQRDQGYFMPEDWSLNKKHFQDFMKRLRKVFLPDTVRFYHCGEYGNVCRHGNQLDILACPSCNVGRPHYHACLFNCDFFDLEPYGSRDGELRYTSPLLESIWKYGFVDVGELNFDSAAYVARYILKKVTGLRKDDHYLFVDEDGVANFLQEEYTTMSRRPGIGKAWFDRYKDDLFPSDEVPVAGRGVFKKMPRYYDELFAIEQPLAMEEIKAIRKKFKEEHKEDFTPQRLESKYKVKKDQIESLRRTVQ
jgi:hypothetical protein